jgi:hypothetical protein
MTIKAPTITITIRRAFAVATAVLAVAVLGSAGPANAANLRAPSLFACNYADVVKTNAVTVYFPDLYTGGGYEAANFTPELYKYTSSGWLRVVSRPWYTATVGPYGVVSSVGGFKWYAGTTGYRNVQFPNLTPGWYAVRSWIYGRSPHWSEVWGAPDDTIMCQVY